MAGGSPDTGGIDTDQENGARSQTEGGVGELEGAQSEGVDTISREQTVLKWGYEQGPAAVSSKYKDVLQATATNLDTRISQLREMLTNSQHQVANYEQNDEEIAASFRKAAGSDTGVASAGGTTVAAAAGAASASAAAGTGFQASGSSGGAGAGASAGTSGSQAGDSSGGGSGFHGSGSSSGFYEGGGDF